MNKTAQAFSDQHELQKAYQIIFGQDPRGAGFILDRQSLARSFKQRAEQFRPDRAEELGRTRQELSEALRAIAIAFDFLADVVGDQERVWVMATIDDGQASDVRPWFPKEVPAESVALEARKPERELENATQRIKAAIGKLKAQTEALARRRDALPAARKEAHQRYELRAKKSLILGRHLHRRGLITLRQLIAAVAWQRAQRPAVGQIAKSWGILTEDQVFEILREKDQGELFCDFAVRKGLMTPFQRLAVVGRQRVMQKPLGSYFVEKGILTEEQVELEVHTLQRLVQKTEEGGE